MADTLTTHRFVTIQQVVRAERPARDDLRTLFREWGLTTSTQEAFWVVAFDSWTQLKTVTEVARGSFNDVVVLRPAVLAAVLAAQTDRFLVAHNHPAGPVEPTPDDIAITRNLMDGANLVGLSFEDHIITGPAGWYSFAAAGLLIPAKELGIKAALKRRR